MRPFAPQLSRTINTSNISAARAAPSSLSFNPNTFTFSKQQSRMSSTNSSDLKIEATNINTAPGVSLSDSQKTLVGSVLDLFAGRANLAKLGLWKDDAEFIDPLAIAKGRQQYEAQWYGLQTAFSELERQHQEVTNAGNPIELDLKMRYVIKGIGKEQVIQSKVLIHTEGEKIAKVEDKWNGTLPDGAIANVSSVLQLLNPFWWLKYAEAWLFWIWSFTWETTPWRAFRRLNAQTMPHIVGVPKNAEEDANKGN